MVMANEVEGIKFAGVKKDNHSTYMPRDADGGVIKLIKRLFL